MKQNTIRTTARIQDTTSHVAAGARLEKYWRESGYSEFFKAFSNRVAGQILPSDNLRVESLVKTYRLRGIGFGNWVTQEDRYNYTAALAMSLFDLNKVLRFDNNIGLFGLVSVTFGSRGISKASAHFEPGTFIINVTRYKRADRLEFPTSKAERFLETGGVGALAHEYGHALDYFAGLFVLQTVAAGTGGRTVNKKLYIEGPAKDRGLVDGFNLLLEKIIWKDLKKEQLSAYYQRLSAATENEYWFRRNELFARCFEKWVGWKLQKMGIRNDFLFQRKYDKRAYPTDAETEQLNPYFEAVIAELRKHARRSTNRK